MSYQSPMPYPVTAPNSTPATVKWAKGLTLALAILDFLVIALVAVVFAVVGAVALGQELPSEMAGMVGTIGVLIFVFLAIWAGLWILVLVGFAKRKGWSRVCAAVFFGLRALSTISVLFDSSEGSGAIATSLGTVAVGGAAIYCMFAPDTSRWLRNDVVAVSLYGSAGKTQPGAMAPYGQGGESNAIGYGNGSWGSQPNGQQGSNSWGQPSVDSWGQQPDPWGQSQQPDAWGQQPDSWGQPSVDSWGQQPDSRGQSQQPPTSWS